MHLTMMTVLDQMFNKALIDVIVFRSIEYLMQTSRRGMIKATM
jgi:hypothetical protein